MQKVKDFVKAYERFKWQYISQLISPNIIVLRSELYLYLIPNTNKMYGD